MRFVPPKPTIPEIDTSAFVSLSQAERKALASSENVRKYTDKYAPKSQPNKKRRKAERARRRRKWWAENWIGIVGLIVALIGAAASVIALLM